MQRITERSPFLHPRAAEALTLATRPLEEGPQPQPVAVVLADGSVRSLTATADGSRTTGRVQGRDWTLWWQRRSWVEAS